MHTHRGVRATFLALAGIVFFAYWVIFDPTNDAKASQFEWQFVVGFSAALLILAVAILLYGDMVGGRWVHRLSIVAAIGLAISGVANVFEDGFGIDWVFFVFVLGTATALISLIGATVAIAATNQSSHKLLALVPGCTVVAVIAFVAIGGPLMLITWLAAATVSLKLPDPQTTPIACAVDRSHDPSDTACQCSAPPRARICAVMGGVSERRPSAIRWIRGTPSSARRAEQ